MGGMLLYTVHQRAVPAGRDPDVVLIKEGMCWPSLFVPLFWLLFRRQWLGLLAYLAATAALGGLGSALGLPAAAQTLALLVFAVLVAVSANDWRRWRLQAAGYGLIDVVSGRDLTEAERRLFRRLAAAAAAPLPAGDAAVRPASPAAGRRRVEPLTPFATPFDPV